MPHNTDLWIRDLPDRFLVYIDAELISEQGARCIQAALDTNIGNWRRNPEGRMRDLLQVHTG